MTQAPLGLVFNRNPQDGNAEKDLTDLSFNAPVYRLQTESDGYESKEWARIEVFRHDLLPNFSQMLPKSTEFSYLLPVVISYSLQVAK